MKKYLVNTYGNHWVKCDGAESAAQEVIDCVDDYYWDDYLDEVWGEVKICGYNSGADLCKLYSLGMKFYIILCNLIIAFCPDFW